MKLESDLKAFFKVKGIDKDNNIGTINLRRKILLNALRKDYPERKAINNYNRIIQNNPLYQMVH